MRKKKTSMIRPELKKLAEELAKEAVEKSFHEYEIHHRTMAIKTLYSLNSSEYLHLYLLTMQNFRMLHTWLKG